MGRIVIVLGMMLAGWILRSVLAQAPPQHDPSAWGTDHVGKALPEFASGDQCLFCHRDVGPEWGTNRHGQTVRDIDPDHPGKAALSQRAESKAQAEEILLILGRNRRHRFLRPGQDYGKLDLLTSSWTPQQGGTPGRLIAPERPTWDRERFGTQCAGCHATAVDATKGIFATRSLDCFTCHGDVPGEHARDPALALLSRKKQDSARVVTSLCASCHLRGGVSRSSGRPYANGFVPGDNLFRDFRVDFRDSTLVTLSPADRHVYDNVRDVVIGGREEVTCLSCHTIHRSSGKKHQRVPVGPVCSSCHEPDKPYSERKPFSAHNRTCEFGLETHP